MPTTIRELRQHMNQTQIYAMLSDLLVYGLLPEVLATPSAEQKKETLVRLASQQFWETLSLPGGLSAAGYRSLLTHLAAHTGDELETGGLAQQAGITPAQVRSCLAQLEDSGLVFRLEVYPAGQHPDSVGHFKVYFADNGLLTAVLEEFSPTTARLDPRRLWANFVLAERLKNRRAQRPTSLAFYWHSAAGYRLDYLEEDGGEVAGYAIGFEIQMMDSIRAFNQVFPGALFMTVTTKNFWAFVS